MSSYVRSLALTSTEAGREWLLKALHPTDPTIGGVGLPDGTAVDTVVLELTTTYTIGAGNFNVAPTTPWSAKIVLTPHFLPGSVTMVEPASPAHTGQLVMRYPVFTSGTGPDFDLSVLAGLAEAWRLCAQSITIHLDANSTKDSGTLVAAQQVTKPLMLIPGMATSGRIQAPILMFDESSASHGDNPDYAALMSLPNAYQSNLREGLYMPLKLTNTSQRWVSRREQVLIAASAAVNTAGATGWLLGNAATPAFPFWDIDGPLRSAVNNEITGYPTSAFLGDIWGHIAITGVDPSSSIVLKVRSVMELKVQARSSYAPHLKPAPFPDHTAVENYFTLARVMPHAFPADYNDAGKILGVIGKAVNVVKPFLKFVPAVGPVMDKHADMMSKTLVDLGNAVSTARKDYKAKNPKASKKQRRRQVLKTVAKGKGKELLKANIREFTSLPGSGI